jgi:signal transduction histidine kinase
MKSHEIEPGLLPVFRLLIGVRLVLAVLTLCVWLAEPAERLRRLPLLALAETLLLFGYLHWGAARRALKGWYIPVAIIVATVGPIVSYAVALVLRYLSEGATGAIADDIWLLLLTLLIPLLAISWQYRFRVVVAYSALMALLLLVMPLPMRALGGPGPRDALEPLIFMTILFLVVGYIVTRLVRAQRQQRMELAEANLQLARHTVTLQQLTISQERNRMARELHDTLAHSLSAAAIQLEAVRSLWEADPAEARTLLDQSLRTTRQGLKETRRAIADLRASPLEDLGLGLAVQSLAQAVAARTGAGLILDVPDHIEGVSPATEQALYRITEEALTNIEHHAAATQIGIRLERHPAALRLTVRDNGTGFDPSYPPENGHFGLQGMRERAELVGGAVRIESEPGWGTTIQVEMRNLL